MKSIHLTTLMAGLCLLAANSGAQESGGFITNGLIAYYPLNGTAIDASGNGNSGTIAGATPTEDRFGVAGMAFLFNGSNSSITCNIPDLPTGAAPRTVSLWAKAQTKALGENLIFWGTAQNKKSFGIINNSSPYTWQGQSWGGGDDVNSGVVVDANWHNVVVEYDGANLSIFIDGVEKGSLGIGLQTGFSSLTIGGFPSTQAFSGAINEVRIYNRVLSSNEVSELYQSFTTGIIAVPTITIAGLTNQTYSIQYVNDVSSTNWTTLVSNIVLQASPYVYPDTNAIGQPERFYRVVAQGF
ncbi:MAG: LamG domain-containing protein [Limisphaerales bacterium]